MKKIPTKIKKEKETKTIRIIPRVYEKFVTRARRVREKYEIDTKSTLERAIIRTTMYSSLCHLEVISYS